METALSKAALLPSGQTATATGIAAADFERVVCEHQQCVYRVLLALVRDPDAAETLAQECFLRAFQKRASYRGEASIATWLVRIAVNLARDYAKNRRRAFWKRLLFGGQDENVAAEMRAAADPAASPEQVLVARQGVEAVWRVVEQLPPQQHEVFVLRFVEELTLEEIATAMDLEVGTVKAHLHRGVSAVRQRLKGVSSHPAHACREHAGAQR